MKKIVIAAAIAFAAVCSHAASMSWNVPGTTDQVGLNVYIVSMIAENGFKDAADISNYLLGTEGNTGTFNAGRKIAASGTVGGLDGSKSGQMQDFYYVIVNSDETGYWAAKSSAEIYTTATTHVDSELAAGTIMAGTATPFGGTVTPPGPTPDVPEPTSGLLLVLGGAALALRRKQK